ncbi:MarR family winged helix-turn-helix transcriptional regulator [Paenibacillus glycanilyticus]|uniref:MarR family transcriptional regulator n=1 Tax=Paenibacillus glycanilyticus TaxID=126569 RepID=A0ABQ6NRE7_9BACL|nr:MarR family transcriptional regulator [Paenibacillus glycanilyticus]GMK47104.1 MarR family transcriptional regulator [Paenibacillus glycanilyticus]
MNKDNHQETIQRLRESFTRFAKAEWRQRSVNGLNKSELRILFCIMMNTDVDNPKIRVSEISSKLLVTTPTVTQLLKKLIADGLVERTVDPDDRRSVGIELTPKGEQIAKEADEQLNQHLSGLVEHLGEEQTLMLSDLLTKAYNYFNEKD